jgi:hypothetical protein
VYLCARYLAEPPAAEITKGIAEDRVKTEATPTTTTASSVDPNIQQRIDSINNVAIAIRNIAASISDT